MTPKTTAQLQAEAAEAERQRVEQERLRAEEERTRQAAQQSGWWDWFKSFLPDFSFFNILLCGAMLCGAYFLGRTEDGKKILGGIFGEKPVNDFFAKGDQMLAGLATSVGINIDISQHFVKKSIDDIRKTLAENKVPPKVIAVLAEDKPTFDGFISTITAANGGKLGINDLKMDAIIKGPALDALLKPENRAFTVSLMVAALPADAGISKKTLTTLIEHNTRNGKVTDSLRTLFAAGQDGRVQALQAQLVDSIGAVSSVKAIEALLKSENRGFIRALGIDNLAIVMAEKTPALTQKTLDAALAFGDAIDKNPANSGTNRPRTLAVLRAVARMGDGVKVEEAFKGITADQLSGFFAVPGNQTAVGNFLSVAQPAFARLWGNADQGIAEVLASKPDADKILRFMRGEKTWYENMGTKVADMLSLSLETKLRYAGDKLEENAPVMAKALTFLDQSAKGTTARS